MSPSAAKPRSHARSLVFTVVGAVSAASILVILALAAIFVPTLAILALGAILVPILAITLWHLVRNWGWWRVRGEEGNRRYVKTWHGWVAKDKHDQRQRTPWYRNMFGVKATTAHTVRISWKPQGAESHRTLQQWRGTNMRRMLLWLGIYRADERDVGSATDVEMGTIPEPPTIRITEASAADTVRSQYFLRPISIEQVDGPSESRSIGTTHVMSGALRQSSGFEDIGDTVRRRGGSTEHSSIWQANSSETSRATITQFIMPTHNFRTPAWADQLFSVQTSQDTTTPLSSRNTSGNQARERSQALSKLPLTPLVQSAAAERVRRAVRSSPASSTPPVMSALAGLRSSTQLSAAIDLDSLSSYLESSSAYGRYGSLTAGRVLPFDALEPNSSPATVRSQSPTQRLEARARPSIMGISPCIKRQFSGESKHDKLSGQPVVEKAVFVGVQNALPEHEDEEPLHGITTHYEYIQPLAVATPRPRMTGFWESNSNLGPASQLNLDNTQDASNAALPLDSIPNFATQLGSTALPSYSPKPTEPSFAPLSPPKRGSPPKASGPTDILTPKLLPRRSTTHTSFIPSLSLADPTTPIPQLPHPPVETPFSLLSLVEKAHQEELRQRLQWLDLRCTIKNRGTALPVLSETREAVAEPGSSDTVLRKRGGLRRVGRFERGGHLQAAAGFGGSEHGGKRASECGAVRAKPKVFISRALSGGLLMCYRVEWRETTVRCMVEWMTIAR